MVEAFSRWNLSDWPMLKPYTKVSSRLAVEMTALEEAYGSPCLLSLIRSCGLFEVRAVETGSGPEYWYRLKKIETAASR